MTRAGAVLVALALGGCAAIPVEIVAPVPQAGASPPAAYEREPVEREPLKCFERARHFAGVVEVPCDIAEEAKG
jgi:hypothetical protein